MEKKLKKTHINVPINILQKKFCICVGMDHDFIIINGKKEQKKLLDHTKIRKGFSYPHFFLFLLLLLFLSSYSWKRKTTTIITTLLSFFFLVVFGKLGKFFVYKCDLYNRIDRSIDGNVFGCCFYATAILWRSFFSVKHHFRQTLFF